MIYKFGNWYEQGKRIYPNAKQLKDLQATLEVTEVQSPSQDGEDATDSHTEPSNHFVTEVYTGGKKNVVESVPPKPEDMYIKPPAKRTYAKKVKAE